MRVGRAELVGILVAQGDVPQLHVPVARRQRRSVRRRGEARRAIEDLEDARARGGRALGQAERDPERAHRRDEHVQVEDEGAELAEREVRVDDRLASQEQHRRQPQLGQEADHRVVPGLQARGHHRLVEHAGDAVAKAAQLERLACEGLHDAHAGDVLLGVGGQLGDPLLDLLDGGARAAAVALGDDHDERDGHHRDQAELGVDVDHRHAGEHERERGLQDEDEPVAEEEAHGLQIDGRAGHQLAGLLVVEEAELELLEVSVEQLAQVEFDRQGDAPGDQAAEVGEHPADEHDPDDHDREREQRVAVVVARGELVVLGVFGAFLKRVHGTAGEIGQRDRDHHRRAGQQPGGDQRALVGAKEPEKSVEGGHSCSVNDYRTGVRAAPATPAASRS